MQSCRKAFLPEGQELQIFDEQHNDFHTYVPQKSKKNVVSGMAGSISVTDFSFHLKLHHRACHSIVTGPVFTYSVFLLFILDVCTNFDF